MSERIGLNVKKPQVNRDNSDSRMRRTDHSRSVNPSVDRILFLQRTVGNRAVQRLLSSGALQAKLRIGQPGDVYEQEADRVTDVVMRMPNSQIRSKEDTPKIRRTSSIANSLEVHPDIESGLKTQRGRGQPLPNHTRAFFEPRFGYDFSKVRIHSDHRTGSIAKSLHARAFTIGTDIGFNAGEYVSNTKRGQNLLAHELVHVIQQDSVSGKPSNQKIVMRNGGEQPAAIASPSDVEQQELPTPELTDAPSLAPDQAADRTPEGYDVDWSIDYNEVIRGNVPPQFRRDRRSGNTPNHDILIIHALNMHPNIRQAGDAVHFDGAHLFPDGPVRLGPNRHPANIDGNVSGLIDYGGARDWGINCDFDRRVLRSRRTQITSHLRGLACDMMTAGRRDIEEMDGYLLTEGQGMLNDPELLQAVTIDINENPRRYTHRLDSIPYPVIDSDKTFLGYIDVISEVEEREVDTRARRRQEVENIVETRDEQEILQRTHDWQRKVQSVVEGMAWSFSRMTDDLVWRYVDRQLELDADGRICGDYTLDTSLWSEAGIDVDADISTILNMLIDLARARGVRQLRRFIERSIPLGRWISDLLPDLNLPDDSIQAQIDLSGGSSIDTGFGVNACLIGRVNYFRQVQDFNQHRETLRQHVQGHRSQQDYTDTVSVFEEIIRTGRIVETSSRQLDISDVETRVQRTVQRERNPVPFLRIQGQRSFR